MPRIFSAVLKKRNRGCSVLLLLAAGAILELSACAADVKTENKTEIPSINQKVIGGTESWRRYQVQIHFSDTGYHSCGGSLIAPEWVLTAAHCVCAYCDNGQCVLADKESRHIVLAEHDLSESEGTEQEIAVENFYPHPDYYCTTEKGENAQINDIALIHLETGANLTDFSVETIRPAIGDDGEGLWPTVSGWGFTAACPTTETDILMEALAFVWDNEREVCEEASQSGQGRSIADSELCAGDSDGNPGPCSGDSGGPLAVERDNDAWELMGVVHGGGSTCCNTVGIFERVSYYYDWIRQYVFDSAVYPVLDYMVIPYS